MSNKDKVRLTLYCCSMPPVCVIAERGHAEEVATRMGEAEGIIKVSGRINDVDGNSIEVILDRMDVVGVEIVGINEKF